MVFRDVRGEPFNDDERLKNIRWCPACSAFDEVPRDITNCTWPDTVKPCPLDPTLLLVAEDYHPHG